jgi:prolyl-tRNA editing enzyme YbaK/EbsC (Cys-tRNA(Pro) deacylase)
MAQLSKSTQRVEEALAQSGLPLQVVELSASTRTAKEAADTIGCEVAQIVKSLVFRTVNTKKPVLVLASGVNRVNEQAIAAELNEPIEKADAEFIRDQTGFAIGGVAPVGHTHPLLTFIDTDLLQYQDLWAAAGTPNTVFRLSSSQIESLTNGKVINVK